MPHRLRDGLSWCVCNGRAVFLDLPHDRYFRLSPQDDARFQEWAMSSGSDDAAPQSLVEAGLLVACPAPAPRAVPLVVPLTIDLAEDTRREARLIDIARAIVAQRQAASLIRHRGLAGAIAALASDGPASRSRPADFQAAARRVAAAFASMPLAFAKAGQCLPRALAAYRMCRLAGAEPSLVFGVQLEPFAAHCWLQLGSEVVIGDLEQARMFTPILALR